MIKPYRARWPVFLLGLLLLACTQQPRFPFEQPTPAMIEPGTVEVRVGASSDDAEQPTSGTIDLTSSVLDLTFKGSHQTVGLRFNGLQIPPGAVITNAYIQFKARDINAEATSLLIQGQAVDDAPTFTSAKFSISSRPKTAASVTWSPAPWSNVNATGPDQRTPNLSSVIQEITDRAGWASGNSLVLLATGTGLRRAWSYDSSRSGAPLLHVDYEGAEPQYALTVTKTGGGSGTVTGDGISCGATCSASYPSGTVVTLAASPDAGATFAGWGGACSGTGSCTVTVDADKTVAATFDTLPGGDEGIVALPQVAHFLTGCLAGSNCEPESQRAVPSTDPAAVAFNPSSGHLFLADSEIDELAPPRDPIDSFSHVGATIFETSLTGDPLFNKWDATKRTNTEPANKEPTGIAFCSSSEHFFTTNDEHKAIYRYAYSPTLRSVGYVSTASTAGLDDPEGITCDPAENRLYVVGGKGIEIGVYRYTTKFVFERIIDLFATAGTPEGVPSDPEGIAFDAESGHLLLVSTPDMAVFEYTTDGVFIRKFSLGGYSPQPIAPQGLTVGPSSADLQKTSLYIADGGLDNNDVPSERDGVIFEAEIVRSE